LKRVRRNRKYFCSAYNGKFCGNPITTNWYYFKNFALYAKRSICNDSKKQNLDDNLAEIAGIFSIE